MSNAASYLQSNDYVAFGIPDADSIGVAVDTASRIINTFLSRPEGLIYGVDANGNPAYMAAKTGRSLTLNGNVSIGQDVIVTLPAGYPIGLNNIGDVVILDKANSGLCEACVIATCISANQNVTPQVLPTMTLKNVQFAHVNPTIDFDLLIGEERSVPSKRSNVLVSRTPLASIIAASGRYSYGRRSDSIMGYDMGTNLLAFVSAFGGPPLWQWVNPSDIDINSQSGELFIPPGLLLAYFSDVRLRYVAGYAAANIPFEIKTACAQIVRGLIDTPMGGNLKMYKSGDVTLERFGANIMDDNIKELISSWKVRAFL